MRQRQIGLDVLRALAMFFVICQHMIGQGGLLGHTDVGTGKYYFLSFLEILVYCAVDIYGITTGYLLCQKKFRLARLMKIWLTTVFWSVAVSCCFFVLVPETRTLSEMVSMFLPVLRGRYWFFTAYFVVMLVSPVLNVVIWNLSKCQFHLLFAALFLIFGVIPVCSLGNDVLRISTGHHFSWMIVLYLIGGYFKRYEHADMPKRSMRWLLMYFLLAVVHLLYSGLMQSVGLGSWKGLFLTYPSPLVLGEAICLFLFFRDICKATPEDSILGKIMRIVSPGVYSVYVIHVHPLVFWNKGIIGWFRNWDSWGGLQVFGAMLGTAQAVFFACVLLDALRQQLFRILGIDRTVRKLSDRAECWIRTRIS